MEKKEATFPSLAQMDMRNLFEVGFYFSIYVENYKGVIAMNKKELNRIANRIKRANEAMKKAIFELSDYRKVMNKIDLGDEKTLRGLALLLNDYHTEHNGFESPFGIYASYVQEFEDDMKILDEAIEELIK